MIKNLQKLLNILEMILSSLSKRARNDRILRGLEILSKLKLLFLIFFSS